MYSPADIDDRIEMRGRLRLQLIRPDGSEEIREVNNLVITSGKQLIANRMQAVPTNQHVQYMAVGTNATAPAVGDGGLGAEVIGSRTALSNTTLNIATLTYTATFGAGVGTGALAEAGLFNAPTAAVMLARTTFAVINKAAADILNATWTVTVG